MSWLSDLGALAKATAGFISSNNIGSQLAKTALLGYALNRAQNSINKQNSKPDAANSTRTDTSVREQLVPSTDNAIPVVYGTAFLKGIISDAEMQDQKFMWYCITICEKTGTLMSTGADSVISFEEVFINNQAVSFNPDGITVNSLISDDGVVNLDVNGLIKIYCYNNGSNSPVKVTGQNAGATSSAIALMPSWGLNHQMSNLVFAIVRLEYNKERNVTSLGDISFKIKNTMTLPGDCIYDYITNTRYGAGIPPTEIKSI